MTSPAPSDVRATYRLQIHADFPLAAAARLVPYLARLGVSHVYGSPLLHARAGSLHGYDVVDPGSVDPARGGELGLAELHTALAHHRMGLILDVVPNHMGTGAENARWDDVLAHGRASAYARWFDVDWEAGEDRLVLPILGGPLRDVVAAGEIRVEHDPARGFRVRYFEHDLPVDPATAARLLDGCARRLAGAAAAEVAAVATALRALPPREPGHGERAHAARQTLERLAAAGAADPAVGRALTGELEALAAPEARTRLRALLDAQAYRLVHWRRAGRLVNYRRFFNIADLVAIHAEDDEVFAASHARILEWVAEGIVDGLRIDHVDGLWDPRRYLERLRDATAAVRPNRPTPIWVEKILCGAEHLRPGWPVAGTTGYEFANSLEAMLIHPGGHRAIDAWYRRSTVGGPRHLDFPAIVAGAKRRVLGTWLAADVTRLAAPLPALLVRTGGPADVSARDAERALVEMAVGLPVYRTYAPADGGELDAEDRTLVELATGLAVGAGRAREDVLRALAGVLLGRVPPEAVAAARRFTLRFQQLSSPAMAKGLEDTALYAYVALASRNEVGGDAAPLPTDAAADLHAANRERATAWPAALLATSTHDTKRSADTRARLDVLTEAAPLWIRTAARWRRRNRVYRTRLGRRLLPDDNTEYLLYQSMLGIWPHEGRTPERTRTLGERLATYAVKAAREAKVHTSWLAPDAAFEDALLRFLDGLLADDELLGEVDALVRALSPAAGWNGLARTLVHLTAPGVPDLYQGDELWNLALADPDNRRPVDFARRGRLLGALEQHGTGEGSFARPEEDELKLHVVRMALDARRRAPALFARGGYEALSAVGSLAPHVFAFVRRHERDAAVTIVSRLVHGLSGDGSPVGARVWHDTAVLLPGLGGRPTTELLTGRRIAVPADERLPIADAFAALPLALLRGEP